MTDLLSGVLSRLVGLLPLTAAETLAARLLRRIAAKTQGEAALIALLRLDNLVYILAGQQAKNVATNGHFKSRLTGYHDFFLSRCRPREHILDVGCGMGELALRLAREAGCRVTAVDFNDRSLEIARANDHAGLVEWIAADVTTCDFNDKIDVVVLSNVLEHLQNRAFFLAHLTQRTGADRFLIRVPNFERDWRVPLKRELGVEWRLDSTHETEHTQDELIDELSKAGIKVRHLECRWGELWCEAHSSRIAS